MKRFALAAVAALLLSACAGAVSAIPTPAAAGPIVRGPGSQSVTRLQPFAIAQSAPSGLYANGALLSAPATLTQVGSTPGGLPTSIVVSPHIKGYTGTLFQIVSPCTAHASPAGYAVICAPQASLDNQRFGIAQNEQGRIYCFHGPGLNGACVDEGPDATHPGSEILAGDQFTVTLVGTGVATAGTFTTGFTFAPFTSKPLATTPRAELLVRWVTGGSTPSPTPAPTSTPLSTGERATPADAFVDSIGVNTHFNYSGTPYYDEFSAVEQALVNMGVRHLRCAESGSTNSPYVGFLHSLHAAGMDCLYVVQIQGQTAADPLGSRYHQPDFDAFVSLAQVTPRDGFEAPNELNISGWSNWATLARTSSQKLRQMMKANAVTAGLVEIGPSMTNPKAYAVVGDLSSVIDHANMHNYAGGRTPEDLNFIPTWISGAEAMSPAIPWTTETGYCEDIKASVPPMDVNDIYMSRDYLEQYRDGIPRTYKYEFVSANSTGAGQFDRCGFIETNLAPKPSYYTIRNEIAALADPGYTSFATSVLSYTFGGDTRSIHHVLLQKHDGTFALVLWSADSVWNGLAELYPAPHAVTLTLGNASALSAETFVKDGSLRPIAVSGQNLPLSIGTTPTVVFAR